jgi:transforming growth factor-beta-induced protein
MKIFSIKSTFLALLAFGFLFQSCNKDNDDSVTEVVSPTTIVDVAKATPELSSLVAALGAADGDLPTVLSGTGPFTVLAPTNDAFSTFLSDNGFASLNEVPTDVLTQVLLNHVISGEVIASDLISAGNGYTNSLATGAGERAMSLYFDTSNGVSFNGKSTVATADVNASNGVVHVVDAVIGLPTIVDHAVANSNFSSLVGSLTLDGNTVFTDLLSTPGDFTVFAPINDAFTAFENPNSNELNTILKNHVVAGASVFSDQLTNSYVTTEATMPMTENKLNLYINIDNGVTLNGKSSVIIADVVASNGVIHAVDQVIDLPTVVDFATSNPNFATLVTALTRDDLTTDFVTILSSTDKELAPFTVFAPTNEAFTALLTELEADGLGDIDEPTLSATLKNHVVSGSNVLSSQLTDNMEIETLGGTIKTDLSNGNKLVDKNERESNISAFDVQSVNGVIHVIDKVILPNLEK